MATTEEQINKLTIEFDQKQEALRTEFNKRMHDVREDALRTAVEDMSSKIDRRLAGIEARLTELEKADEG